jgi:hypothetical protein
MLIQLRGNNDASVRERAVSAHDAELIERGAKAVKQSLQEAEYSLDINTIQKMLMVTKGHGRSA